MYQLQAYYKSILEPTYIFASLPRRAQEIFSALEYSSLYKFDLVNATEERKFGQTAIKNWSAKKCIAEAQARGADITQGKWHALSGCYARHRRPVARSKSLLCATPQASGPL